MTFYIKWHWRRLTLSSQSRGLGWDARRLMFNQHVAVQWRQAGINTLPGVAFTATSSKRTEEMHRSKSQKGRRSEGRGWGRRRIQHVAGDNMQHSVGETPFLPSLPLTHPWHGRNVQIKETSEVRMWEGVAVGIREDRKKIKNAVLTLRQKKTLPLQSALWDVSQAQC